MDPRGAPACAAYWWLDPASLPPEGPPGTYHHARRPTDLVWAERDHPLLDPRKENAMASRSPFVGARLKRREDPALLQGLGQYVDDIPLAGTLHAAFLRSPYAHARLTGLHVEAARQHPGVIAVLTGQDILGKV